MRLKKYKEFMFSSKFREDKKKGYLFDLHVHTKYSKCSKNEIIPLVEIYRRSGYAGIAITDHDTIKGAKKAEEYVKEKNYDFKVIKGCEFSTDKGHILVLGITDNIFDEINQKFGYKSKNALELIEFLSKKNLVFGFSHPFGGIFRKKAKDQTLLKKCDFLETFNGRNRSLSDKKALLASAKLKKAMIAGSDCHFYSEINRVYTFSPSLDVLQEIKSKRTLSHGIHVNRYWNLFRSFLAKAFYYFRKESKKK